MWYHLIRFNENELYNYKKKFLKRINQDKVILKINRPMLFHNNIKLNNCESSKKSCETAAENTKQERCG